MLRSKMAAIVAGLAAALAIRAAPVPQEQIAPEALLDSRCAIYFRFDGMAQHREAWQKTALAEVWRSGLGDAAGKLGEQLRDLLASPLLGLPLPAEVLKHLPAILEGAWEHGVVAGLHLLSAQEPLLQLTLVLPGQASHEKHISELLLWLADDQNWKLTALKGTERRMQQIQIPDTNWHITWWSERGHLVLLLGNQSPRTTVDVLEGKTPSVLQNEWYKQLAAGPGYASCCRGYIYAKPLIEALRALGPKWREFTATIGLEDIPAISWHLGVQERALRSTLCVHFKPGQRRGIAALFPDAQAGIESVWQDLQKLPPLSPHADVSVYRFDISAFSREVRRLIEALAKEFFDAEAQKIQQELEELLQTPGMKVVQELLPHLGEVVVTSNASADGLFFTGKMGAIQLKNPAGAKKVLSKLGRLKLGELEIECQRRHYRGVELMCMTLQLPPTLPIVPTLAIVDDWLVVAHYPQPIQGLILRREMKNWSRWQPSAQAQKILASVKTSGPTRLVGFSETDPRRTVQFLGSLLPIIGGAIHAGTDGTFDPTLLPPTQALTEPLFPNVTLYLAEPDRFRIESYNSLPLPNLGLSWFYLGALFFRLDL